MATPLETPTLTVTPADRWTWAARMWALVVALAGTATLVTYAALAATSEQSLGALNGIVFTFSYFTVVSNLFNTIVMWSLVANPRNDGKVFRWLRMTSLVMMTITGAIYALVLAASARPEGLYVYTNFGAHYFGPWATVAGFLIFGPRPRFRWREVWLMLVIPAIWLIYTLVHGTFLTTPPTNTTGVVPGQPMHFYPYPFINAEHPTALIPGLAGSGYAGVAINIVVVVVLALLLAAMYLGLDRLLSHRRRPTPL
jgi:hypothetical protein